MSETRTLNELVALEGLPPWPGGEIALFYSKVPIDFCDYQFSVRDAAVLSGVPEATIRNWETRVSELNIGKRIVFRRLRFCLADVVQLRVLFYLSVLLGIALDIAVKVSASAAEIARSGGPLLNSRILLGFGDDGQVSIGQDALGWGAWGAFAKSIAGLPQVVVPVGEITRDIVERLA